MRRKYMTVVLMYVVAGLSFITCQSFNWETHLKAEGEGVQRIRVNNFDRALGAKNASWLMNHDDIKNTWVLWYEELDPRNSYSIMSEAYLTCDRGIINKKIVVTIYNDRGRKVEQHSKILAQHNCHRHPRGKREILENRLFHALYHNDKAKIEYCINHGVDVNRKYVFHDGDNGDPYFPILMAAKGCGLDVIKLLVEAGADVNTIDNGKTLYEDVSVLTEAFSNKDKINVVRYLLDRGANVNFVDGKHGRSVMQRAVHYAGNSAELLALLAAKGAGLNESDRSGNTPLIEAAGFRDNYNLIGFLIDNGADIHAKNNLGENTLLRAVLSDASDSRTIKLLASKGARVRMADINKEAPPERRSLIINMLRNMNAIK